MNFEELLPPKQVNMFEPAWPYELYGKIKIEIEKSPEKNTNFKFVVVDGIKLTAELIFEKLRLASEGFEKCYNKEQEDGDPNNLAIFYRHLSKDFFELSKQTIFRLNKHSVAKINPLVESVLKKLNNIV